MEMPGPDWSNEGAYVFSLPTTQVGYCVVQSTEILNVLEDDLIVAAELVPIYFDDEENCAPLCVTISIDPCKIEKNIKFIIKSTFTYSDDQLILMDP